MKENRAEEKDIRDIVLISTLVWNIAYIYNKSIF